MVCVCVCVCVCGVCVCVCVCGIYDHEMKCNECDGTESYSVTSIESYFNRGWGRVNSRSEKEILWKALVKGIINMQRTLRS